VRGVLPLFGGGDVWEVGGWDDGDEDEEDNITRETRQIITNNKEIGKEVPPRRSLDARTIVLQGQAT